MKAVVFHGIGDIRLETVPEPKISKPTDAIVRITASAICGTDLHMIRGTVTGMKPGTVLGHEAIGIVEELGPDVRNLRKGDRVVVPSTICCGYCSYCRAGYTSQCDHANPNGPAAGTAFYGGPKDTGPFDGLQAEYARVPFANACLLKLPDRIPDAAAILLSDIFPTGWFGAQLAEITPGDTVAVFGCGPVGQFAIASARLMGAGRVFAIDRVASRLEMARAQGAEAIDFEAEDPIEVLQRLTGGIGVDRVIDAVGVDAVAPKANPGGRQWVPGNAPSQVVEWAAKALAKAGTLSVIGVYPPNDRSFPLGAAMNKNLTVKMGNCNHRTVLPHLIELVETGVFDPTTVLTQVEPLTDVIEAYKAFDRREAGWVKVMLEPWREQRQAA